MDPFDPEHRADPYPHYAELRAAGPVVHVAERDIWAITTYDAVRDVLRRPESFISGMGTEYVRLEPGGIRGPLIDNDPPDHTRIRRAVQRWFTPSAIEKQRATVREIVDRLVDEMLESGEHDVVRSMARPLPVLVMGAVLGLDGPDVETVSAWMDSLFHLFGPDAEPEHQVRMDEALAWLMPELATLPEGSIAKSIMESGGDMIENVGIVFSIWAAGIDTSTNLISTGLHTFAANPEEWGRVDDPVAAVEECLRHRSPIRSFMRRTTAETEVLGHKIPSGADVCVLYACANRDEARYVDADRFDVRRNPTDHLAFGAGIHLCLGAPLLRLEVSELFSSLRQSVERFEPSGQPVPNLSAVIQGYLELPLRAVPA